MGYSGTTNKQRGVNEFSVKEALNYLLAGVKPYFDSDGDNTAQQIKDETGELHFLEVHNPNSTDAYIQLFDSKAADVSVGTTTPVLSLLVPAGNGTDDGAMDKVFLPAVHFQFGIHYACTTTETGNGDPSTGLYVNALYK